MKNSERYAVEKFLTCVHPEHAFEDILRQINIGGNNVPLPTASHHDQGTLIRAIRDTQKEYEGLIMATGGSETGGAPTIVVEVNSGVIEMATSDTKANVIVLDADTEGGDEENIHEIDGDEYYVHTFRLQDDPESQSRVDPSYVEHILKQTQDTPAPAVPKARSGVLR